MVERKNKLKRVIVDILVLITIGLILFILPVRIEKQGLELFLFKFLLVSAGVVHAHISRKLMFPYIDFKTETKQMSKVLIIVWYATFIWAWARGG